MDAYLPCSSRSLPAARPDGRIVRGMRTRQGLIEAYLFLRRSRPLCPGARDIADAAGVSTRTLFERFETLPRLACAAAAHLDSLSSAPRSADLTASLDARVAALVESCAADCEAWWPLALASRSETERSEALLEILRRRRASLLSRALHLLSPELDRLAAAEREQFARVFGVVTSIEAWCQLRFDDELPGFAIVGLWRDLLVNQIQGTLRRKPRPRLPPVPHDLVATLAAE